MNQERNNMKKLISSLVICICAFGAANAAKFTSCGAGYVLAPHAQIDGINAAECQKLWCRDLETGKTMGNGNTANTGYVDTPIPNQICDVSGACIDCFGARKWCAGEPAGEWNVEYGAYTRGGADNATFQSYQKGTCFAWRLEKPDCPDGQAAILQNDEWVCVTAADITTGSRPSGVRRTSGMRRLN